MAEIINLEDVEKFEELSSILADLYKIPPIEIRLTITISGSRGIMHTYKLEMLRLQSLRFEKDWVELYFARDMSSILKTMNDLIDFERKKGELAK